MKKILTLLFSVCLAVGVMAQTMEQNVISGGGNYSENGGISLSWTLGEPVIATFENGGLVLTQGFQQPLFQFNGQVVIIPAGWSGISSWVDPDNPLVEDIFEPVEDDLVILQNPLGQVYWPDFDINSIINWNPQHGYVIKMTQEVVVLFEGLAESDLSVNLPSGWWNMPVLAPNNVPSNTLFNQLGSNLVIVKEIAGNRIWWPAQGIFTLNFVAPGKAYQILLTTADELDFTPFNAPQPIGPSYIELNQLANVTPWNNVEFTGVSHTIAIDQAAWAGIEGISYGDYLGVFTQNGLCAGMILYTGKEENLSITAFGDDLTTPSVTEGFNAEEYMSFRLYRPSTTEEFDIAAEFDPAMPNTDIYQANGLSRITGMTTVATSIDDPFALNDVQLYPNPANELVNIKLIGTVSSEAILQIFSIESGKLVREMRIQDNLIELDINDLAQGVYFVKVTDGNNVIVKRLIKHSNQF